MRCLLERLPRVGLTESFDLRLNATERAGLHIERQAHPQVFLATATRTRALRASTSHRQLHGSSHRREHPPSRCIAHDDIDNCFVMAEDGRRDGCIAYDPADSRVVAITENEHKRLLADAAARESEVNLVGSCHCSAIEFTAVTREQLSVLDCNCSVCSQRGYLHFSIPKEHVQWTKGQDNTSSYAWNTGVAQHTFCQTCGVQAIYSPRSNPDHYSINIRCVRPETLPPLVPIVQLNGKKFSTAANA